MLAQLLDLPDFQGFLVGALLIVIAVLLVILLQRRMVIRELRAKKEELNKQLAAWTNKAQILEEQNLSLRELNEDKNNIISVVSHDLKAPLNRIFALSNLLYLSSENLTEEQRDYMDKMTIVVREGLGLIRNLLDIRTIEYKGVLANVEDIDLGKAVDEVVASYDEYTRNKEQQIETSLGDASPIIIQSDRQYLNRIIDNLLSNAVKFSPRKSTIKVELGRNGTKACIRIKDQGPGVHPDDQGKLFEKFQILSARPTGGESSSGLGLSIAKTLVDILDGNIYYDDTSEPGATFVVQLPLQSSSPDS